MKKALVVFLILAVAGGLFAEISWGGNVSTGIGVGFDNTDADPTLGLIRSRGDNGFQVQFKASGKVATENYGTFTGDIGYRGSVGKFGATDGALTYNGFDAGRLTWAAPGSLGLTLAVGDGGPGGTGTMGGWNTTLTAGEGQGLAARLIPVTGLTIAASAVFGRAQTTFDKIVYAAGVKYALPDLLNVAANVNFDQTKGDKEKLNVAAGVDILPLVKAMGFTAMAFDALTRNGISAAKSDIGIGENIGFKTGDLSLSLGARQLFWGGDKDDAHEFIPMRFNLGVSYKVSDLITVGIDGRYVIGNTPGWNYRDAGNMSDLDWKKDKSALGISPYVTFSVGGPQIQLGYNLQNDMSKDKGAVTMQHLVYGTFNVNF